MEKWVLDPFVFGTYFATVLSPLHAPACVNACNDLCWRQFSARVHSVHVWTYLDWTIIIFSHNYQFDDQIFNFLIYFLLGQTSPPIYFPEVKYALYYSWAFIMQ